MDFFCREDRNLDFMVNLGQMLRRADGPVTPESVSRLCVHQVACMQFINIMVHSVENMNFRVHLQYQFTCHGLDDYLEVVLQSQSTFDSMLKQV